MNKEHFVIVGNGPAGHHAALTLRQKAPEARITLISKNHGPCYRPHLLPAYIAGKIPEQAIYVSPVDSYKDRGIKLRSGQKVVGLNPTQKEIILDHKEIVRFSGLIIAVGGKPRIPEPLFVFRDHMFTLKTLEHAKVWIEKLSHVDSILIIGGDLTSLAVTRALLSLDKKVIFMPNEDAFWPVRCNKALFEAVGQKLEERGVEVLAYHRVRSVSRLSHHAYEIQANGEKVQVGMIGAFFGLVPDIRFLVGCGLQIDRGILVDEHLNTGFEAIYATGDCAQVYHPELRDYWVSIGHDNAVHLGRLAAMNLLGGKIPAEVAKEKIFDVQGIKVNTSWWTEF
ncbi:MAG: FAD/NAD(P)-binding oxidoreductase [Desulfobacteraceae bacterium]|jgi:nitrite reductase (NADH) large subunit